VRLCCQLLLSLLGSALAFTVPSASPSHQLSAIAEYCGENIDGQSFSASAFSYSTSQYYYVDVEFDGDEAIISFSNGGHLRVTLDDEEIDDPSDISAFDYRRGVYWDLDVEGLDCDE